VITLVLGGTRSGKSAVAEAPATRLPQPVTYVATAVVGDDADLAQRIAAHRVRRPEGWATVEAGAALATVLGSTPDGTMLVDSLGPWVAASADLTPDGDGLVAALEARRGHTVVVSEEVGLSVHAPTAAGRRFVDALGDVNQAVADVATEVLLVVAGRVLPLLRAPR
jgi:adenosyl cobinamide kinase/adenosyl cobinamide phosphate guanylyltransferase